MKYIVFNDPHIDVTPPTSKRSDNYMEACFQKLEWIRHVALRDRCEFLVCTGDWFHRKTPTAVPHELVGLVLGWLDAVYQDGKYVVSIAGNHDVRYGDTSTDGLKKHPYGVLMHHPAFNHLADGSILHSRSGDVAISGSSYRRPISVLGEAIEDMSQFTSYSAVSPKMFNVHLVHASCVASKPMWRPYTLVKSACSQTTADLIHCGHIHDDVGTWEHTNALNKPCIFTNVGSLTRGARTEENLARMPKALMVEYRVSIGKAEIETLCLPHAPSNEIYNVAEYREEKLKKSEISKWSEQLRAELERTEEGAEEPLEETVAKSGSLDHRSRELACDILTEVGG